jgi:hypothetical protein
MLLGFNALKSTTFYAIYLLLHRRAMKHKSNSLSLQQPTTAANKARHVYVPLRNKVTKLENANKITPSL